MRKSIKGRGNQVPYFSLRRNEGLRRLIHYYFQFVKYITYEHGSYPHSPVVIDSS